MVAISCSYLSELGESVSQLARLAFTEDGVTADVTASVLGLQGRRTRAVIICREPVHFVGRAWLEAVVAAYLEICPTTDLRVEALAEDGQALPAQTRLLALEGDAAAIVGLERVLLNFLGRAIGIANTTATYVETVRQVSQITHILDTRKTLPGFRFFDKYAVLCGGGRNHRMGLADMVLIKENHIAQLGGVTAALTHVRRRLDRDLPIQVEVTNLAQLDEALAADCPLIMLDNFTPEWVAEARQRDLGQSELEVSGGINLSNIASYAVHHPHRISIGALTHSVKAPDLSLLTHA